MDALVAFVVVVLISAGWYVYSKRSTRQEQQARDLADAIGDTFSYMASPVDAESIQQLLSEMGSTVDVIQSVKDDVQDEHLFAGDSLILGDRRGNARRGVTLEEEAEAWEKSISTTAEFKRFKKELPLIKARLNVFSDVVESLFPVVLPQRLRDRHVYVIGKSGAGKTTLLTWLIFQDLANNQGVAFLTPEAETITQGLLPYVPSWRAGDVIYFNPADEQCRFAFNPLHLDEDEDIDRKVENVFTSITRLMAGDGSARINQLLRQAIYALVERPRSTLLDIPRLLDRDDPSFRQQVARELRDEQTKHFWRSTYDTFPKNAHVPILTRLARFVRPRRVRNVLCRPEKGLDFREIMDSGKVLLCSLPDGLLGETVSELLGGLIMSELQLAAVGRADVAPSERRRFYVYLDEFHSFTAHANVSYEKLLSRARKYRLPLTLAHQQTGQLPAGLVREILGNVSTLVSFLVSRRDANLISRECLRDDLPEEPAVDPDELITLDVGDTFTKIGTHAFPMCVTSTLQDFDRNPATRDEITAASRRASSKSPAASGGGPSREDGRADAGSEIPADPFADLTDPQDLY